MWKRMCVSVCVSGGGGASNWITVLYTFNHRNIINQLYFNKTKQDTLHLGILGKVYLGGGMGWGLKDTWETFR